MRGRLYGLDALRGLAALIVLAMHIFGFRGGHLAVDFFFMLSGYVMARTYESRLRSGEISPLRFLIKRYWRLWPTMVIGAILGFAVFGGTPWQFAAALLLLPAGSVAPYALNLPAWSIFYELVANALHGTFIARLGNLWPLLIISSLGLVLGFSYGGFPRILPETTLVMQALVIFRVLVSYTLGVMLFRGIGDISPVRIPLWTGLVLLPAYIAFVSAVDFAFWPLPFIFPIAPLLMLSGLDRQDAPFLRYMGDISFPLYAIHMPVVVLLHGNLLAQITVPILLASTWPLADRLRRYRKASSAR